VLSWDPKLYFAFRELGWVVRAIFLLQYVSDLKLRQLNQTAPKKSEAFKKFVQWVCFGGEGVIAENVCGINSSENRYRIGRRWSLAVWGRVCDLV
jgi:TnpA family transposase